MHILYMYKMCIYTKLIVIVVLLLPLLLIIVRNSKLILLVDPKTGNNLVCFIL